MCAVLLPPGVNPIAVKYITYNIISFRYLAVAWYDIRRGLIFYSVALYVCRCLTVAWYDAGYVRYVIQGLLDGIPPANWGFSWFS
jgi:hypothetical protein